MGWTSVWFCFFTLSVASVAEIQARLVRNHVSSICSTWGREHFKTFDGDVYQFPGTCEYNLVSDCHEAYQEFSVHMKRSNIDGIPTVAYVVVTIDDLTFHLTKSQITVNDEPVSLPYFKTGVHLEQNAVYIKLQSKVGITVMWNREDAVMVEIDNDYANRTCGLCGDFNGVPVYDEFIHEGRQINPIEYGNRQKVHLPNDECEDPYEGDDESPLPENTQDKCKKFYATCSDMLRSESWSSCTSQINPEPYIQACVQDMCGCNDTPSDFCLCSTLSEFSRQCSHAGGDPPRWRKADFCAKQCPYNMVYEESGSPCMDTCSRRDTSSMCEDHKMDGCFCHSGTVFDDISMRGCIPQSQCQCKHDKIYESGEVYRQDREKCTCREGSWACQSLQAPETCAVEEGSHVTTFDGKTFTFHGDCYYTLAKVESKDGRSPKFTVLAQLMPCTNQEFDTCLKTVKLLLNNNKNNGITFTSDGIVKQNSQTIILPYHSGDITIFQASSFHILLQTNFGLQIQVQVVPLMQVYIKLDQSYTGKTRGLCGNYNMVLSDEMKTPQGIVEGTATTFTNSWKANVMCSDKEERLEDPCSFSVENEHYAKHWCALLKSQNSTFTSCHSLVDPDIYYKRCMYSSCNCEKSEACLCGVFSSYARACASMGVVLPDWKENVCDKYMKSCPGSQVFSFNHQRCQLTCRSLALKEQNCISIFSPVDGCSCAEGSYLDDEGICVPVSKCPCFYNDVYIKPGKSVSIKDEHCVCTNGILHCRSLRLRGATCPSPKVFFNCSSTSSGELGLQCARTCSNLDSDDCDFTECESGCRCPNGLLDDGKGSCVTEEECPCQHEGQIYQPGTKIPNQCNNCICKSGRWLCTRNKCPGSCVFYGSGHYSTFDQKTYGFPGDCAYVAVKNNCGNQAVLNSFGIITENVPCGSTSATCSKAIRIQMGDKEIKFFKNKFEEKDLGYGPEITYKIRRVGLYLVLESNIGVGVIWDRKTTVRIVLEPQHSGEVCGLCGNFDGDAQNDFMTQNNIVVNNALEFGNSWKLSSTCPDVTEYENPCDASPNRHHWAKQMCKIITGPTFKDCQRKVDPQPFYENCVKDSCACDSGGDCDCFCTAVAAYAQACNEARVCVAWRTPEICPIFCDYYNKPGECQWHYHKCHQPCFETCLYPNGVCTNPLPLLEGCFPKCPPETPIFDESTQTCVKVCPTPPPPTTPPTTTTTSTTTTPPTTPCSPECEWSDWYDVHDPITDHSDWETYENITNSGAHICENRKEIECRSTLFPDKDLDDFLAETHQVVTCDLNYGFICRKEDQKRPPRKCYDYMIRVCCDNCNTAPTTPPPTTTTTTTTPPTTTTTTPPTTTTTTPPTTTTTTPPTTTTTTPPTTTTTTPPTTTTTTPPTTTTTTPPTTTTTTPPTTTTTTPPTTTTTTPPTTTTTTPPTTTTTTPPTTTTTTPPTTTTTTPPTTTTTTPPTTTTTTPPTTTTTTPPTTTTTTPPTTTTTTPPTTTTTTPPTTTTTTPPTTTTTTPPTTTTTTPPTTTTTTPPTTTTTTPPTTTTTTPPTTTTTTPPTTTTTTPPTTTTTTPPTTTTTTPPTTTTTTPPTTTTTTPPTTTTTTPPTTTTTTPPTTTTTTPPTTTTTTPPTTTTTTPPTTTTTTPPTTTTTTPPTTTTTTPPTTTTTTPPTTTTTTPPTTTTTTPPTTTTTTPPTTTTTTPPTTTTTIPPSTTTTTPPTTTTTTHPTTTTTTPPTTTTTTSPTTTTTVSTTCSPECEWSDWYDIHDPITDHSDWETYENITNSGAHICENRKEIECRSTLFPDKDLDDFLAETHQVVTCDLNYGFICRKEDQKRPPRKCYDYMIRVCCDNCNTAPTTPPPTTTTTTPPTTTTTTPPTTTTTTPPTTTTTTPPTTTTTTPPTTTTTTPPTTTTTTPPTTTTTTPPTTTTTTPPTTTTTTPPTTTTTTPPTTTTTTPPTTTTTPPTTTTTTPPTTTTTPPTTTTTTPPTTTTTTPPTTTTTTPPTTTTTTPPTTTTTTPPTTTTTLPPTTTTTTPPTTTTTTPPTTTTTTPPTTTTTTPPTTTTTTPPTTTTTTPPTTTTTTPPTTTTTTPPTTTTTTPPTTTTTTPPTTTTTTPPTTTTTTPPTTTTTTPPTTTTTTPPTTTTTTPPTTTTTTPPTTTTTTPPTTTTTTPPTTTTTTPPTTTTTTPPTTTTTPPTTTTTTPPTTTTTTPPTTTTTTPPTTTTTTPPTTTTTTPPTTTTTTPPTTTTTTPPTTTTTTPPTTTTTTPPTTTTTTPPTTTTTTPPTTTTTTPPNHYNYNSTNHNHYNTPNHYHYNSTNHNHYNTPNHYHYNSTNHNHNNTPNHYNYNSTNHNHYNTPNHYNYNSTNHNHYNTPNHYHYNSTNHNHYNTPNHYHYNSTNHNHNNAPNHYNYNSTNHYNYNSTNHNHNNAPNHYNYNSTNHYHYNSTNHYHYNSTNHNHYNTPNHYHYNSTNHNHDNTPNHHNYNSTNHNHNNTPNHYNYYSTNHNHYNTPNHYNYNSTNHNHYNTPNHYHYNSTNHNHYNTPNHYNYNSTNHNHNNAPNHYNYNSTNHNHNNAPNHYNYNSTNHDHYNSTNHYHYNSTNHNHYNTPNHYHYNSTNHNHNAPNHYNYNSTNHYHNNTPNHYNYNSTNHNYHNTPNHHNYNSTNHNHYNTPNHYNYNSTNHNHYNTPNHYNYNSTNHNHYNTPNSYTTWTHTSYTRVSRMECNTK
ncbi:LOW QUALITY PROTEIN: mucin-2-like [Gouania willdenowi]|uniref:LOW QUALITY PROTEIN: mucin-2-like n=1 Tax=Gouania willdenowi TaxID=441366 RepID=UPI001055170B|nr:LOW QUALITY PROTEIN: mucin-2-like [Gouania willdenowi]